MMVPGLGQIDAFYPILVEIWDEHKIMDFLQRKFQNRYSTHRNSKDILKPCVQMYTILMAGESHQNLVGTRQYITSMNHYNPYAVRNRNGFMGFNETFISFYG